MASTHDDLHSEEYENTMKLLREAITFTPPSFIPEGFLYRYRRNIDHAVEEIRTGNVYLSATSELNDPFDSSYGLTDEAFLAEEYKVKYLFKIIATVFALPENYETVWKSLTGLSIAEKTSVELFLQYAPDIIEEPKPVVVSYLKLLLSVGARRLSANYKTASFSETNTSIPMWAYYADDHKGVCLEYDLSRLRDENKSEKALKQSFCKVHYSSKRPTERQAESALIVKGTEWAHENEWRLIRYTKDEYISVPCLSAVYLGTSSGPKTMDAIIDAIRCRGTSIKLYKCSPHQTNYEIRPYRIHYETPNA